MILFYILLLIMMVYVIELSLKSLHMLQQNLYNENNRYIKWIFKNKELLKINFLGIIGAILLEYSKIKILTYILMFLLMGLYLFSLYYDKKKRKRSQNKKPLVFTKRLKRLVVTTSVLYAIPLVSSLIFDYDRNFWLLVLSIMTSLNYFVVFVALIVNHPIERLVYKYYETKAKTKLKSMNNLKVIGITGSYGKTSCKNILHDILSVKYNTLATPKSLNTFNGLMITVNNKLDKFDEVFIAEMGAYVRGEIKGLSELVNPKYAIITSIGKCHLETFGSQENIVKGKMELIEHLKEDGIGVLNKDDPNQVSYERKSKCKIVWIGIENENVDVRATNIVCDSKGTSFDCHFKNDDKVYRFETKLLGKHSVYNILASIALGYELGISIKDLQYGVRKVKPVEHRLELKQLGNFYQIDDAFNSNPSGAKAALDVLAMMDGYKVVVTPGMIELGKEEYNLNKEFGRQISLVADKTILVGEKQTKAIYDGLKECGYDDKKIIIINDVKEAYSIINKLDRKNVYALFENDLPDTYTEKERKK